MPKLLDLDRDKFLDEIKSNWDKHKDPTKTKDLIQYMLDNAFSKKSKGSLEALSKDKLRAIILNGDEEQTQSVKSSESKSFASGLIDFLEEFKIEIHKKSLNPFVKKQFTKQIDKQAEKIEDEKIFEKLGWFGFGFMGVLFVLDMVFANGYKDTIVKFKEFRDRKKNKVDSNTLEAEIVEKAS